MPRSNLALLALASLVASCSPVTRPDEVEIRLANRSARNFDRVVVNFYQERVDYGALPAGAVSAYRRATRAYRYAYVEVHVDTARLVLQPTDFVGETPLSSGRYTYALSVTAHRSLILALERD